MLNAPAAPTYKSGKQSVAPNGTASPADARAALLQFLAQMAAELSSGNVDLPCFPDVVLRIRKALDEDRKQRKERPELGLEEDKDNAAYLDSLGWVLFKKKNLKEAKKYLLEAIQDPDGQHVEIIDRELQLRGGRRLGRGSRRLLGRLGMSDARRERQRRQAERRCSPQTGHQSARFTYSRS